jgi:hypothetical protein
MRSIGHEIESSRSKLLLSEAMVKPWRDRENAKRWLRQMAALISSEFSRVYRRLIAISGGSSAAPIPAQKTGSRR